MFKIFKYTISTNEKEMNISLPKGFKILSIQTQEDIARMWVKLNPKNPHVKVKFRVIETGELISNKEEKRLKYVGTALSFEGLYVVHIFQYKK